MKRCQWANSNQLLIKYHDFEWGIPVYDDRLLFEMLNLEGAQAGLSWLSVLRRRSSYRLAFNNFDAKIIAKYPKSKYDELLNDPGIIRNRLKIKAVIANAQAYLKIVETYGTFSSYIWNFTFNKQLTFRDRHLAIEISQTISKDLKQNGFSFVGPTICFSFMQAAGLINDHEPDCFYFKSRSN